MHGSLGQLIHERRAKMIIDPHVCESQNLLVPRVLRSSRAHRDRANIVLVAVVAVAVCVPDHWADASVLSLYVIVTSVWPYSRAC